MNVTTQSFRSGYISVMDGLLYMKVAVDIHALQKTKSFYKSLDAV